MLRTRREILIRQATLDTSNKRSTLPGIFLSSGKMEGTITVPWKKHWYHFVSEQLLCYVHCWRVGRFEGRTSSKKKEREKRKLTSPWYCHLFPRLSIGLRDATKYVRKRFICIRCCTSFTDGSPSEFLYNPAFSPLWSDLATSTPASTHSHPMSSANCFSERSISASVAISGNRLSNPKLDSVSKASDLTSSSVECSMNRLFQPRIDSVSKTSDLAPSSIAWPRRSHSKLWLDSVSKTSDLMLWASCGGEDEGHQSMQAISVPCSVNRFSKLKVDSVSKAYDFVFWSCRGEHEGNWFIPAVSSFQRDQKGVT